MRRQWLGTLTVLALAVLAVACQPREQAKDKAKEEKAKTDVVAQDVAAPKPDPAPTPTPAADVVAAPETTAPDVAQPTPPEVDVKARLAKFAPAVIGVEPEQIPEKHRPVIAKLVEASKLMDAIFLRQVHEQNPVWREQIAADPALADTLAYFDMMGGPWDRLDEDKPFWGTVAKPIGASFYPEDLKAADFEAYIAANPAEKEAFMGYFTVIRRDGDKLVAKPYNEVYKEWLEPAAKLLEEAAALTDDARLAKYLNSRAASFRSNEYRDSDRDWMDLGDGDIEIVIGPYEVYEDGLMGYKAAFEAFLTLRDHKSSEELAKIVGYLPEMEQALPMPDEFKRTEIKLESPISVVNVVYNAGDAGAGIQTLAFNLPNDEVVAAEKGTKKVMMHNIAQAKFSNVLVPIANAMMDPDQAKLVSFDAFFNHTLLHEASHGLGPKNIKPVEGKDPLTVNLALKDLYSTIEEVKADILGMYFAFWLIDKGFYAAEYREQVYASVLGGFFRSVRFGANEAHGRANMIQFNYLVEKGAVVRTESGTYRFVPEKMQEAVTGLSTDILAIELEGNYDTAKAFIDKYAAVPEELKTKLASLSTIPTDIRPEFSIVEQMKSWPAPAAPMEPAAPTP